MGWKPGGGGSGSGTISKITSVDDSVTITDAEGPTTDLSVAGGGGDVSSVFTRTGAVTAESGDYTVGEVTGAAPLASPALTGTPTAPTRSALTNNTDIATTAYADSAVGVETSRAETAEALLAPKASPTFTGTPAAPTAAGGTNTTQIATTAFVIANASSSGVSSFNTRTGAVVPAAGDYTSLEVPNVVGTVTQSATPAIDTDNLSVASITGLAQAITSMTTNLTGTPVHGQDLRIEITDNGTARAITWGAKFASTTITLPTTTVVSTILRIQFTWNTVKSTWDCIGVA